MSGHKPQGLLESYWFAKNYERAANARRMSLNLFRNRPQNQVVTNQARNTGNKGPNKGNGEKKNAGFARKHGFLDINAR